VQVAEPLGQLLTVSFETSAGLGGVGSWQV